MAVLGFVMGTAGALVLTLAATDMEISFRAESSTSATEVDRILDQALLENHRVRGIDDRQPGQPRIAAQRRLMGEHDFEAQYNQRPMPPGGALFKLEWLDPGAALELAAILGRDVDVLFGPAYKGKVFIADYAQGWIKELTFDDEYSTFVSERMFDARSIWLIARRASVPQWRSTIAGSALSFPLTMNPSPEISITYSRLPT